MKGITMKTMTKQEFSLDGLYNFNIGLRKVMYNDLTKGLNCRSLVLLVVLIVLSFVVSTAHCGSFISVMKPISEKRLDYSVCQSKDIRNTVDMFSELQGCKVVEGFVQIVLIDKADESDYANISFPELREITGYLLLYRVQGLRSLGKLFPNLTVIRGNTLILNYALVVYEMLQLQDIGLISLTNILRGAVYFAKNPMLCFVETIDWDMVAPNGKEEHHIMNNKKTVECPLCPQTIQNVSCPKNTYNGESLCWNTNFCQRRSVSCNGTFSTEECCHPFCLGGCEDRNRNSCFVCKHFLHSNQCVDNCPAGTYEYLNRRCVTVDECYNMPKPLEITDNNINNKPWKPFGGKCLLECPPGYLEREVYIEEVVRRKCEKCQGICKKECPGANVDSIATIQKLKGCTSIKGALEIQVRGGNFVKELEENLNTIEEIDEYLKIVRSFPLVSLNFLSSLREIHGYKLESNKYALIVLDNANLVELWDWNHRQSSLKIDNGRLFFHFNPKLCFEKIEDLRKKTNLPLHTDLEIAKNSNGDQTACNVEELIVTVYKKTPMAVLIKWRQFENHDRRTLLGYVVYSIEAPYRNVSMYDRRDACSDDTWQVDDVSVTDDSDTSEEKEVNHIIAQLKPYTQYAFYVKTYTVTTETRGAQSRIQYFRTNPYTPSEPHSITIYANSSSELVLHWKPPLKPNGNVTHYIIKAELVPDNEEFADQRNLCLEPLIFPDIKSSSIKETSQEAFGLSDENLFAPDSGVCSCNRKVIDNKLREKEIHFEDHLQNLIYVKRVDSQSSRDRREVTRMSSVLFDHKENMNFDSEEENYKVNGVFVRFHQVVYDSEHSFVIRDLKHFSHYKISIQACREWESDEDQTQPTNCSNKGVIAGRTLALKGADNIDSQQVYWDGSNKTHNVIKLKWEEPLNPNSVILTYQVEYWRTDIENYKPIVECITRNQFSCMGNWYVLKNLSPGNYSFRIRATSLFGNGQYTKISYFYIEEDSVSTVLQVTIIIIAVMLFIFLIVVPIIVCYIQKYLNVNFNTKLFASVNPEYVPSRKVYTPDTWEVPRDNVKINEAIGQGAFGMVYEGELITSDATSVRCAVKTVSGNSKTLEHDRLEFLNEASIMKAFDAYYVVKLLGVVSVGHPTLVIMELMANGDLKTYLRSCRQETNYFKQSALIGKDILRMAVEIADGMAYLSAKKYVHRDLAARNCMVSENLTVKIGDFGLARDVYETEYYRKGNKGVLPVRWMAPECLKDGVFTSLSDIWSYGVVLYEMATLASQPYQGLTNEEVLKFVTEGGILEQPDNCPESLYQLMLMCWQQNPDERPSFMTLVGLLKEYSSPEFASVSFYDSEKGQESRALEATEETPLTSSRIVAALPNDTCHNDDPFDGDEKQLDSPVNSGDIDLKYAGELWIPNEDHEEDPFADFNTPYMLMLPGKKNNEQEPGCSKQNN